VGKREILTMVKRKYFKHLIINLTLSKLLMIVIILGLSSKAFSKEITLFDKDGDAVAYIADDEDATIYLWDGTPVAYLESNGNAFHIYGFNGKHLGWFEDGVVRDRGGYAVGFIKGAINKTTKYEPYKGYKKYKPYKSYTQYAPCKPYYKSQFSGTYLSLFLKAGAK
jgi:hypothetical protein